MSYSPYSPMTKEPFVLDLADCKEANDLHRRIRITFGFPGYYGENWDAMWDCLTDIFLHEDDRRAILVKGYEAMDKEMQDYCQPMKQIFSLLQQEYPGISVRYL